MVNFFIEMQIKVEWHLIEFIYQTLNLLRFLVSHYNTRDSHSSKWFGIRLESCAHRTSEDQQVFAKLMPFTDYMRPTTGTELTNKLGES